MVSTVEERPRLTWPGFGVNYSNEESRQSFIRERRRHTSISSQFKLEKRVEVLELGLAKQIAFN